jgi:hypothetical protein
MFIASVNIKSGMMNTQMEVLNINMNKDLSINNVMSLHYELMRATEQYDMYLELRDSKMSDLWYRQMELITEEMKQIGETND